MQCGLLLPLAASASVPWERRPDGKQRRSGGALPLPHVFRSCCVTCLVCLCGH